MSRFEDAPNHVITLMNSIREQYFPELAGCRIKVLFDLKKRMSGGDIVLGRIQKTNDLLRHLTTEEADADDGFDYIMYLDKMIYDNIEDEDRIRLIRHELRHTSTDLDSSTNPYKLRGHTINDFYSEVALNVEDPRWAERCGQMGISLYEQAAER